MWVLCRHTKGAASLRDPKAACAWYLLAPQLGVRGRGRLWESNGGCLTHHARTSRTSAQNQAGDVYPDRVLLVAQATYYLNQERWRDKNKTFSLTFVRNFFSICFYFCPLLIFFSSNWNSSTSWHYLSLPTSFSVTLVQLTALTNVFMFLRKKSFISLALENLSVGMWPTLLPLLSCGVAWLMCSVVASSFSISCWPQKFRYQVPAPSPASCLNFTLPSKLNLWRGLPRSCYSVALLLLLSSCD